MSVARQARGTRAILPHWVVLFLFLFNTPETMQASENAQKDKPTSLQTPAQKLEQENETYRSLEAFARAISLLEAMYVDEDHVNPQELVDKALRGIVSSLDPHTTYLPAKELRDFTSDTTGRFGGIGVIIVNSNGRLKIVEVVEDSPGENAGLKKGDIIFAVGDLTITANNIEEALTKLKGLPGSEVTISVWKKADQEAYEKLSPEKRKKTKPRLTVLKMKRAVIRTPSVKHMRLAQGYAYIHVSVFQEDTGEQVDKAMRKYEAENGGKLDGLILDLRGNPGGLLDQAVRIADLFLDSGIIVSTIGRERSKQEVEFASKRTTHPHMSMIVLVNGGSASASEIVAGALQDHERALVMGTKTFGKGSVQSIIPLPNGAGLKMTIARYFTPKGRSIQARGIVPDIRVESSRSARAESLTSEEDRNNRREADLKGHIGADNISQESAETTFQKDISQWPENFQKDELLRTAYTYIKSWSRFAPKAPLSATRAKNEAKAEKKVEGEKTKK